jgi:hypothetical protein
MIVLGERFEKGNFLPDLLIAADAFNRAIESENPPWSSSRLPGRGLF